MKIQFIQDSKGKPTGVFIPINDWRELKKLYKDLEKFENNRSAKNQILENIKTGLEEVELFKNGKLETTSAKDFLNEL